MSPGPGLFLRWEVCEGGRILVPMYDTSTVSPDTNVLMVYARGDDENTYRTSSAYWSLLVQVPEAQKRRELYCALADEAALEPAKEYFEIGPARYGRGIGQVPGYQENTGPVSHPQGAAHGGKSGTVSTAVGGKPGDSDGSETTGTV